MIHDTAIIDSGARLGEGVSVGPYSVIGPDVELGDGCDIGPHVVIKGPTRIGRGNRIFQFASIGEECQDRKYAGEPTELIIGDNNVIREFVTMQRGTVQDKGVTRVGSNGLFMNYCHVAHDCILGDNIIIANAVQLAGHVTIDDHAIIGGGTLVHQFCRIGRHVMLGGNSALYKDVPAFMLASGAPAKPVTINSEGLRRHQFTPEAISALKRAYKVLYRQGLSLQDAKARLAEETEPCIQQLLDSLSDNARGIAR